jgi:AraC-like DNA-binding protein
MNNKASTSSNHVPTALASWMRGLANELKSQGLNPATLFAQAELDIALLDKPEARYPVANTTQLWQQAVNITGDETLGLRAIRHITPATFHAVGLSVMASDTLEQAFDRMRRFADLVTDASEIQLHTLADQFVVELKIKSSTQPADQSIDGFVTLLANAGKGLGDPSLVPLRVDMTRATPKAEHLDLFQKSIGAPVAFNQPVVRLVYALDVVRTKLKGANALVAEHLDLASQAAIDRLKPALSLERLVQEQIKAHLQHGVPTLDSVARELGMSPRNLQRKLAENGTNLVLITDQLRQQLALQRLRHAKDPITAIALDLGFSDPSSFSRACKRWFGQSPSELRLDA